MSEMNVYQKVARLRDLVGAVQKDARNEHFKFDYVSSNAILAAVKGTMSDLGLVVIPSVDKTNVIQVGNSYLTEIWLTYTWINTENPTDRFEQHWYAQGKDSNELGPGKAYTYAEKYLFLKLLNIATSDDDPDKTVTKAKPVKEEEGLASDDAKTKIRDLHLAISTLKGDEFGKGLYTATKKKHGVFTVDKATMTQARQIYADLKKVYDDIKGGA